jgi:Protein of unknown function (DUF3108)
MPAPAYHHRWVLAALAVLPAAAADEAPIPPHRAEYLLTRDGLPFGVMTMELAVDADGGYRYRAHTAPHAAVALMSHALELGDNVTQTEESIGKLDKGRFRPQEYHFRREDTEAGRGLDLTFDWERGRAAILSEGKPWSMDVPAEAQDKLSVLLALRQDLRGEQTRHDYQVADGGRLKTYGFRVLGRESLPGAEGERDTLALERSKDGRDVDYRLWMAPELNQLPVRVEREEAGSLYVMELVRVDASGLPEEAGTQIPAP